MLGMCLAKNRVFHKRSKHIEINYHSIKERVSNNIFELRFVRSEKQVAYMPTKAVPAKVLKLNCALFGLVYEE